MTVSSIGSGLGYQVGTGIESSYGTLATIARFPAPEKGELHHNPQFVQGEGLRQGSLVHDVNDRIWSASDVTGNIETPIRYKGMGQWIGSLMGSLSGSNAATPVQQSGTTAYLQTHLLGAQQGQSLSIQEGIPQTNGTVKTWNTIGAKLLSGQFTAEVGQLLKAVFTVDGQDRLEVGTDPTASSLINSNQAWGFPNLIVYVGPVGSEVQVDGIHKVDFTIKRLSADKRFNAGNVTTAAAGYAIKDEPIDNGFFDIGGTLDTEFIDTTKFVDTFMSQSSFSLRFVFTGPIIATTFHYFFEVDFPACRYNGGDPTVPGPDIVKPILPFKVFNDDTHTPCTIKIQSTDTAI